MTGDNGKAKRKLPPETVSKETNFLKPDLNSEAEPTEGPFYQCTCGYRTRLPNKIRYHCFNGSRIEGAGSHKSVGKVNEKGEPVDEGVKITESGSNGKKPESSTKSSGTEKLTRDSSNITNDLSRAQIFRFTPKVFTCDFTPVMRAAREAVTNEWEWPPDMPFEEFVDRIFLTFFKDRGITLPGYGYIVEEGPIEQEEDISQEINHGREAATELIGSMNI
jgi:hypothetical protein